MFSLDKKYLVHPEGVNCSENPTELPGEEASSIEKELPHFKWGKTAMPLLRSLKAQDLADGHFIKNTKFHILDFLKFCSTRDAPGQISSETNKKVIPVLKKLREQGFYLPECYVTSRVARQYLCSKKST